MIINQGLGGPKGKPKGAPDGQPVNIPVLSLYFIRVTKVQRQRVLLDSLVGASHWEAPNSKHQIPSTKFQTIYVRYYSYCLEFGICDLEFPLRGINGDVILSHQLCQIIFPEKP